MTWIWDNAVLVAFLFALVVVFGALALLAWKAWRAYKIGRQQAARGQAAAAPITAGAERAQARVQDVLDHQAELTATIDEVGARSRELAVLASHMGTAQKILLAPLRYIGR